MEYLEHRTEDDDDPKRKINRRILGNPCGTNCVGLSPPNVNRWLGVSDWSLQGFQFSVFISNFSAFSSTVTMTHI